MSSGLDSTRTNVPSSGELVLEIRLKSALYVAGTVVDEAGQPIPDVQVEATIHFEQTMAYSAFDQTDSKGHFEIFDFPLQLNDFPGGPNTRGQLAFTILQDSRPS